MDAGSAGGRVIAGRYRLAEQLGRGGMGSVWAAEDLTLGSPVAVKLIDPALAEDDAVRGRFYQEAKALAALRSPHVVQILDYGVDEGVPFMAMELLEGETLSFRLARVPILPHAETARILGDVARAVRKAHDAGIVHRDLKPENIFLVRNDDQEVAKVVDFGIAKVASSIGASSRATGVGSLIGTPPYMSPEQVRGATIDFRTDLWAIGVIAFECVCGRLPFDADALGEFVLQICSHPIPVPSEVAPSVPLGFDAWFARAVAREPDDRFQSAKEMVDALRAVLLDAAGVPLSTPPAASPGALPLQRPDDASASPGAAPRPGTLNGAAALVVGVSTPRAGLGARLGKVLGGLAFAVVLVLVWVMKGRTSDVPSAPSSLGPAAGVGDVQERPSTIGEQDAHRTHADPEPVVSPVATAPDVEPAAPSTGEPPVKGGAPNGGRPGAPSDDPAGRRARASGNPPAAPPAAATPSKGASSQAGGKKPEDRIGF